MQIKAAATRDEEAHLVFGVAVLSEEFRSGGDRRVTPVGVVVVGLQRGHIDIPVAAVTVECFDAVSVFGQDLLGRPVYIDVRRDWPAVENDGPRGEFGA